MPKSAYFGLSLSFFLEFLISWVFSARVFFCGRTKKAWLKPHKIDSNAVYWGYLNSRYFGSFHVWRLRYFNISLSTTRCGNKFDLKSRVLVSDADIENLCEQCNNLVSAVYKTSCKTGEGVEDMFVDIARQLSRGSNRWGIFTWGTRLNAALQSVINAIGCVSWALNFASE